MSSPVENLLLTIVKLDRKAQMPIYLQAVQQLVNAIQRGYLLVGTKMPGTRVLGHLLVVHRKTAVAIYGELEAQGWVEVRPNKGTFVIAQGQEVKIYKPYEQLTSLAKYPQQTGYDFRRSNILDNPFDYAQCRYTFNDGVPDIRLTQLQNLTRVYSASMKRKSNRKRIGAYNQEGSEYFKEQLSNFLNMSRGLHIGKENLLITRSAEMSLYIISQTLLSPNDVVLVGALSMFTVNMVFQKMGARILTIPIDDEGIDVSYIRQHFQPGQIRMVYITPHHHYPTTVTLSAQRRVDLLQLATSFGFAIVEDDYDYDFQYDKSVMMPLASADLNGMVIYVGSFGKSLAPAFRTGFVVAPDNIMVEMRKYLGIIDRQGDVVMEYALGEMIEEGEIHRHLKKSLKVYRERRDVCCALLRSELGGVLDFQIPSGGLAIWTRWDTQISLLRVAGQCAKNDLLIPKTLLYQNQTVSAMRIGFGHLSVAEMEVAVGILKQSI